MHYLAYSFIGRRAQNEDCCAVIRITSGPPSSAAWDLLVLADGMGGGAHGADVSREVVDAVTATLGAALAAPVAAAHVPHLLASAVGAAQEQVRALVARQGWEQAGATLVAALVHGDMLWFTYLGDSRLYHWHAATRRLEPLTRDHTVAQMLLDRGLITAEMARTHPLRSQLVCYVGCDDAPTAGVETRSLRRGDRLLLCSDGISGRPAPGALEAAFGHTGLDAVAAALARAAMDARAADNMTLLLYGHDGAPGRTEVPLDLRELEDQYRAAPPEEAPAPPVLLVPALDGPPDDDGDPLGDTLTT
jgi:serine/threonine protein phosphatase PrpC